MGVLYMPFFDLTEIVGLGTVTFATAGKTSVVVDLATLTATAQDDTTSSSIFAHRLGLFATSYIWSGSTPFLPFPHYARTTFAAALETAAIAGMVLNSWTSAALFSLVFNATTARYTFTYSPAVFSVTFSSAVTRNMLGFSALVKSGATTYTGDKTPLFCINSTLTNVSWESDIYEPDGIGNHVIDDSGHGYGLSRAEAPKYKDWIQEYETKLKTHRVLGGQPDGTPDPTTHEHLYEYCRGEKPFILYGVDRAGEYHVAEVYSLRQDGISFKPTRATPGDNTRFHIAYACVLAGVIDGVIT